ncbi:MAG: lamin tail domain-containing protein, partial [Verrucomicrobia bacterium]|nr:lamin tail domain-containing protein [Verrucomicrobiota bacterium]
MGSTCPPCTSATNSFTELVPMSISARISDVPVGSDPLVMVMRVQDTTEPEASGQGMLCDIFRATSSCRLCDPESFLTLFRHPWFCSAHLIHGWVTVRWRVFSKSELETPFRLPYITPVPAPSLVHGPRGAFMMLSFTLLPHRLVLFVAILLLLTLPGLRAAMVINEIHYSPSDKTRPTEFIELLNFSDSPVNLSGWRLTDAVQFTFPSNTLVPAQQTVVIAGTPSSFLTNFGFAPLGPWVGRLRRSGANIQLRDTTGLVVDEVDYRPGFPWPTAARGEGASIELIQPTLDNSLGGSWRSSGYSQGIVSSNSYLALQDPSWRFRKGTNEASIPTNAWRFLSFVEDGSWQTAQAPIGFGDNDDKTDLSKPPWNVPTPMQNNYISLYLRRPFVVPDGPLPTRLRLRVVIEDGCVVWINGREVGRLNMRDKLEKPFDAGLTGRPLGAVAHKAVSGGRPVIQELLVPTRSADLATGTNLIAIHAFNSSLNGLGVSIDCAILGEVADPTPGSPNATQVANAPPQIRQVDHIPLQPAASNSVTITARVTDPDRVGSVMLEYQAVDPGRYIRKSDAAYLTNWISLPMNDEGVSPDLTRGDGLYTAVIPAGVQTHRRLVRYRVVAADLLGASVRVPYPDDPQPNFAYFVYDGVPGWEGAFKPGDAGVQGRVQRFPSDLMRSLPVYHLIANEQDVNRSQYDSGFDGVPMPGALVYDGRVHDHITFHNRGEFSTYVSGKNKWRLHFNNTHELQARDNRGRPYDETWDDI